LGLDFLEDGRSFALADFNHDGRLEVFLKNRNAPQLCLLQNIVPDLPQSISFRLQGTKSNRDAIGAKIKIVAGGQAQFNHVTTASGYASSSAGPVHFGLGTAKEVDEIEIQWPSGTTQVLNHVPTDQILRVKEPK
jgi:hypothetical protein